MKKLVKRAVSLLLVLCLLTALSSSALASDKTFANYLMLGDSISVYCGTPSGKEYTVPYIHPDLAFPGTYAERLLADPELGIRSICSCAHSGWRVQDVLYVLGGSDHTADYMLQYGGDTIARMQKYSPDYIRALQDADLITISLGSNNIIQSILYGLYTGFELEGISFSGSETDRKILDSLGKLKADYGDTEALMTLLNVLETTERGVVLLKNALKMVPDAVREFEECWDELMELIYRTNPDADVLVMGLYNPIGTMIQHTVQTVLSPEDDLKAVTDTAAWLFNESVDPIIDAMNRFLRCGNRYSGRYVFVDVSGVDLVGSKDGIHLGDSGHQYVYTQMKNAIAAHFIPESVPATRVTVAGLLGKLLSCIKRLFF